MNLDSTLMCSVFSVLKLYHCKWKEMCSICSILKSGTVSRFILPNLYFLLVIDPYRIMSLVFENLNFTNKSENRNLICFLQYLNFINESETESRVFLTYQNYYKSLIPTRSCLWFSKMTQKCEQLYT